MGYGHRTPYWESQLSAEKPGSGPCPPQHPHGRVGNANASIPGGKGRREGGREGGREGRSKVERKTWKTRRREGEEGEVCLRRVW